MTFSRCRHDQPLILKGHPILTWKKIQMQNKISREFPVQLSKLSSVEGERFETKFLWQPALGCLLLNNTKMNINWYFNFVWRENKNIWKLLPKHDRWRGSRAGLLNFWLPRKILSRWCFSFVYLPYQFYTYLTNSFFCTLLDWEYSRPKQTYLTHPSDRHDQSTHLTYSRAWPTHPLTHLPL